MAEKSVEAQEMYQEILNWNERIILFILIISISTITIYPAYDYRSDPDAVSFFETLITFPTYLKNALFFAGFGNELSFRKITPETLDEVENCVRTDLSQLCRYHSPDYFGSYADKPELFKIPIGHRRMIEEFVKTRNGLTGDRSSEELPPAKHQRISRKNNVDEAEKVASTLKNVIRSRVHDSTLDLTIEVYIEKGGTSAKVTCPVCAATIISRNDPRSNRKNASISVSNFVRHFNAHKQKTVENSTEKQMYLKDYFSSQESTTEIHKGNNEDRSEVELICLITSTTKTLTRCEKRKRHLDNFIDPKQTELTDFFLLVPKVSAFLDSKGCDQLFNFCDDVDDVGNTITCHDDSEQTGRRTTYLIKILFDLAMEQEHQNKYARRYDDFIKTLCTYFYILGGRHLYEDMQLNFPFPSVSCIVLHLRNSGLKTEEGKVHVDNLKMFLLNRNLEMKVIISEDATRITGGLRYDAPSDQIVGLVPDLQANGMPKYKSFPCSSAVAMKQHIESHKIAQYVYVYMAQPVAPDSPSFCLAVFGTDNVFTAEDVMERWKFITSQLASHGIQVVAHSSDGDSRLLKAMKISTHLSGFSPKAPEEVRFFSAAAYGATVFIQDPIHVGGKLKNRLFDKKQELKIGKLRISTIHLLQLIEKEPKFVHKLNKSDIENAGADRMNFKIVEKITNPAVIQELQKIKGADGTVAFLNLIRDVTEPFTDVSMTTVRRLLLVLRGMFFLRGWRNSLHGQLKHYVTANAYQCVELNAHGLVNYVLATKNPNEFVPTHLNSQTCEKFFRHARSLAPTHSTQINFTMLEFLDKIRRIHYQDEVKCKIGDRFVFAREKKNTKPHSTPALPSIVAISQIAHKAKAEAEESLRSLGIQNPDFKCQLREPNYGPFTNYCEEEEINAQSTVEPADDDIEASIDEQNLIKDLDNSVVKLSDLTECDDPMHFQYHTKNGVKKVRKSLVLWLLCDKQKAPSTDRKSRFIKN